MKKEIICIICPKGCHIMVEGDAQQIASIEGNQCSRGRDYAEAEFLHPERILTSSVPIAGARGRRMLPVRSSVPVPRGLLLACMKEIKAAGVHAPVFMHQVIIPNIAGTGADIIASMPIEQEASHV